MFLHAMSQPHCGTAVQAEGHSVSVRVAAGYVPSTIHAQSGQPIRLVFRREESSSGSGQLVFPACGKSVTLPRGEAVVVELVPTEAGEYEFTCGMGLLRGRLVVSPPAGGLASGTATPTTAAHPQGGRRSWSHPPTHSAYPRGQPPQGEHAVSAVTLVAPSIAAATASKPSRWRSPPRWS
jgi:hypothetical protein